MSAEEGHCDAVLLAPLTEDTFLHNLHARYKRDLIYTYVGNALVSLNPCRALPLYSADLARAYLARPPHQLPPHLYGIAAAAYRWVRDRGESQCIVMTGESGSGKTEAARVCLQCLVLAGAGAGAGAGGAGAGGALTAAGTLLEAFGNAATARNHNASRFGKLLDVDFDFRGVPVAGHITHYLLEKDRVCGAYEGEGERNFHVLYQVVAGAEPQLLKHLKLQRSWEQYRILRGGQHDAAARADTDHFAFTEAAWRTLGLGDEEWSGVLRVLAFVLKAGEARFEPAHNIDGSLGARLQHRAAPQLRDACALVGLRPERLARALGADDPAAEPPDAPDAADAGPAAWAAHRRDRMLAAVYSRLFTWIINAVNVKLKMLSPTAVGRVSQLGVLDVYGLESLAHNGLERLVINYAAERVQAAVGAALVRREQGECAREGVAGAGGAGGAPGAEPEPGAADLLDAGPESVLAALRDAAPRPDPDRALLQRLQRRTHPRLLVMPPDRFQIVHFGGPVVYNVCGMVSRDADVLCPRVSRALSQATEPVLRALFPAGAAAGSPRHGGGAAGRQRALLAALLRRLPPAPRLVRCLRPDAALRPQRFDKHLLRHQLRTQGIVEMALCRRAGWCESLCARAVLARYGVLGAPGAAGAPAEAGAPRDHVRAARHLLRALPIPSAEFAYGRTKVFIRSPRTVWELEALRAARVAALVRGVQRAWRRHRARRRRTAQRLIARAWRAHKERARAASAGAGASAQARACAARVLWRAWCGHARRRYLRGLWARLPARHRSPACAAWPACPAPRLLAAADALLRRLHHRWRCHAYRLRFDQTQRNRMREKVTASLLFLGRKALYAGSVAHPFVGDYVRLRASGAWRRAGAGAGGRDRYVVFADVVRKVSRAGRAAALLAVVSTRALLLLDARTLRPRRRVAAARVRRLSLSPLADDVLCVHVAGADADAGAGADADDAEWAEWPGAEGGCLAGERRRGDVLLRACHVLELATKLFLVVQNACAAPPHVDIATQFEAQLGGARVSVRFHAGAGAGGGSGEGEARLVRRGDRIDVLL